MDRAVGSGGGNCTWTALKKNKKRPNIAWILFILIYGYSLLLFPNPKLVSAFWGFLIPILIIAFLNLMLPIDYIFLS